MSWRGRKRGRKRKRRRKKKRLHATMMMMVLLTRTMRRRRSCETVDLFLLQAGLAVEQKRRRGNNKSKERREGEGRGTCSAGSKLRLDRRSRCLLIFPCCCSPALSFVRPFFLPHVLLHFTQWGGGGDSPDPFPRVNWRRPSIHHIPSCKSVSPLPLSDNKDPFVNSRRIIKWEEWRGKKKEVLFFGTHLGARLLLPSVGSTSSYENTAQDTCRGSHGTQGVIRKVCCCSCLFYYVSQSSPIPSCFLRVFALAATVFFASLRICELLLMFFAKSPAESLPIFSAYTTRVRNMCGLFLFNLFSP